MIKTVCDSCYMAGQEEGAGDDGDDIMSQIGWMMPDHLCDQVETDGEIQCRCGCRHECVGGCRHE